MTLWLKLDDESSIGNPINVPVKPINDIYDNCEDENILSRQEVDDSPTNTNSTVTKIIESARSRDGKQFINMINQFLFLF